MFCSAPIISSFVVRVSDRSGLILGGESEVRIPGKRVEQNFTFHKPGKIARLEPRERSHAHVAACSSQRLRD